MEEIIRKCLPTYEIERKLGEGIYGSVYQVNDNLKQRAVKVVPLLAERSMSAKTTREIGQKLSRDFHAIQAYYNQIKGPGVVEIHDFHLVEKQVTERSARGFLVVLMELCAGNLTDHVIDHFPLPPERIHAMMRQLSIVLDRLSLGREESFLITDLKPSNLLINSAGELLVGDLGGIKRIDSISTTAHSQFTPNWSAPEIVVRGMGPSIASVIYSFGLISYFMAEGELPFEQVDFLERIQRLRKTGVPLKRDDIPPTIRKLIQTCLRFEPETRWRDFDTITRLLTTGESDEKSAGAVEKITVQSTFPLPASKSFSMNARNRGSSGAQKAASAVTAERCWIDPVTGMEFVWIPGGSYFMGSPEDVKGGSGNEGPVHKVILSGFWLGKYPVMQKEWERVMKSNPSFFKSGGDYPVEQVSWTEAVEFCRMLTECNEGRDAFTLPTEAQWEYAARSRGRVHQFSGGDDPEKVAWYLGNADGSTQPVGGKAPNALGLYDMSGNVWEWCRDGYEAEAYSAHTLKNPLFSNGSRGRVRRGGCWFSLASGCRSAKRAKSPESHKNNNMGMRMVRIPLDDNR